MTTSPASPLTATDLPRLLDRCWALAPQVSVRPESFGALLYHFGTRRLTFLKDRRLFDVVQRLDRCPTAREACRSAGIEDAQMAPYARALGTLVAGDMLWERP